MGHWEEKLKAVGEWKEQPTIEQVTAMWAVIAPNIANTSPTGRKRRLEQLAWTTLTRHDYLKAKKPAITSESGAVEVEDEMEVHEGNV
jgi:hypothetical protein